MRDDGQLSVARVPTSVDATSNERDASHETAASREIDVDADKMSYLYIVDEAESPSRTARTPCGNERTAVDSTKEIGV